MLQTSHYPAWPTSGRGRSAIRDEAATIAPPRGEGMKDVQSALVTAHVVINANGYVT